MNDENNICSSCEQEIDMSQEFYSALHSLVTLSHKSFDSPAEVVWIGLSYFMDMNFACAPDADTAKELASDIIKLSNEEIQNANHKSTST